MERTEWRKDSWKKFKISQQPQYKDISYLDTVLKKISELPPIVKIQDIDNLKNKLIQCHENKSFIIQAGDCAERFIDAEDSIIQNKIDFLNYMSHILYYHLKKEIIVIGRIAGQYAKPRSNEYETINNEKIQVYRGDIVNDFDHEDREPNPNRLLEAYTNSVKTIKFINRSNLKTENYSVNVYKDKIKNKSELSPSFINKIHEYYDSIFNQDLNNQIFTSHEGLLLNYEECFIKDYDKKAYNLSGHLLWIGQRTLCKYEAHVEFFRGIENPIGIKVSNRTCVDDLIDIINILNPDNEKGKIILITRFGVDNTENYLTVLCDKIKLYKLNVIFICDPNHGNTKLLDDTKVRYFDEMKEEFLITHRILNEKGMFLSGIHLEASCFKVSECIGGIENRVNFIEKDIYTTYCDPRLNIQQSLEMCDCIGKIISNDEASINKD